MRVVPAQVEQLIHARRPVTTGGAAVQPPRRLIGSGRPIRELCLALIAARDPLRRLLITDSGSDSVAANR